MRALFLLIALAWASVVPALAADVLVLQSARSRAYTDALRGFDAVLKESHQTVVLSDYAEVNVERLVKEERPRVVVVLGDTALAAVRKVREVPVVSLLSLSLNLRKEQPDNIGGISMVAAPEQYLKVFSSMGIRKVGILYDPAKSARYVKRLCHDAKQMGISLVAETIGSPREVQGKLDKMKSCVEALWLLPDSTVVTTVNMEAFLLFSMDRNVPMVTFSSQYLKYGAAAALDVDYFDMGAQAAELTLSLREEGARKVPTLDPRKTSLSTNDSVMRKLARKAPVL